MPSRALISIFLGVALVAAGGAAGTAAGASKRSTKPPARTIAFAKPVTAQWTPIDGAANVFTDGDRYAAWAPSSTTTTVLDTQTGQRIDYPTPATDRPAVDRSRAVGLHDGLLGWVEDNPLDLVPGFKVLDVATGTFTDGAPPVVVPGTPICNEMEGDLLPRFTAFGREGFGGNCYGKGGGSPVVYDWHTGAISFPPSASDAPRQLIDLDAPSLTEPLCAPFKRTPPVEGDDYPYVEKPVIYQRPYLLDVIHPAVAYHRPYEKHLVLRRCGTHAPTDLDAGYVEDAWFHAGRVVWIHIAIAPRTGQVAETLNLFDPRTKAHRALRLPANTTFVSLTATQVFASVGSDGATSTAPLPAFGGFDGGA